MAVIVVKTQAELDALPKSFQEYTRICIESERGVWIRVTEKRENSSVEAWENSSVVARENSSVVARGNSSVVAWENSSVVAWENSSVVAWENSSVVAWENSSVVARENSSVVARENSSVEAWGNSSVVARENSSVVARGNSSVVARGNSEITSFDCSFIVIFGVYVTVKKLFDYSTAVFRRVGARIIEQHETATVKNVSDEMLDRTFEEELSRGYVKADGIIKKLVSRKKIDEIEVFEVSDFPKKTTSYVVKRGDTFSHGETIKKAIEDLRFKISDRDTSKFNHWKNKDTVVTLDEAIAGYRTITGACEMGTKSFVNAQGELPAEMSVAEILNRTDGQYGNGELVRFLEA